MPLEVRLQSDVFGFGQLRHSFANCFIDRISREYLFTTFASLAYAIQVLFELLKGTASLTVRKTLIPMSRKGSYEINPMYWIRCIEYVLCYTGIKTQNLQMNV